MTALTDDLTLTGEIVLLDGPPEVGQFYHLDDEVIMVSGSVTLNYFDAVQHNRWRVRRAQDHTTAATHSSGTTLTVAREFGGEAGAGGVPDPTGAPDGQAIRTAAGEYELASTFGPEGSGPSDGTATVTADAPAGVGSAEIDVGADAAVGSDGSVFVGASSPDGAALVQNNATTATGTATARLDAEATGAGDSEARLAVVSGVTVLAGVVASHVDGVGDSLEIIDGDGVLGSDAFGSVLTGDATVGSKWVVLDPLTSTGTIVISAGVGPTIQVTIASDGAFEISGTGVVRMPFLPTADPVVAGQLWNDAGTLKVSAG